MCYSKSTLDYFNNSIKCSTDKILAKINAFQSIIDYHLCNQCDRELKKSYNVGKCCQKVFCNECANKKPFCCGIEMEFDCIKIK